MPFPALDLYPSDVLFPSGEAAVVDGLVATLNGMVLNGTDSYGVEWSTSMIDGWDGSPASTIALTQKTRAPGAWVGPRQLTPRHISLTGLLQAPDADTAEDAFDRLNAAATLDGSVLTVQRGTRVRSAVVYRQAEVGQQELTGTLFQWSVDLIAPDPRKFTSALSASTSLPSVSGGLTIPFTVPFSIGSTVVSGQCFLTNPGNTTGPVVLRIDGPVVGPQITHVGSGAVLTFASTLSLGSGEWLTVDMDRQVALANGQSSRNSWISSRGWSGFEAGDNTWAFTAVSGSGLVTVTATPAYL